MTSEEIRGGAVGPDDRTRNNWLREIALQLSLLNEHLVEADAAVFGTALDPQAPKMKIKVR